MERRCLSVAFSVLVSAVAFHRAGLADDHWPQFRGPGGSAVATQANPPAHWSATENVTWVKEIPGRGWSSPIVWGQRVFVTSAISTDGSFKEPSTGIFGNDYWEELQAQGLSEEEVMARFAERDLELPKETESIRYMVYAIDTVTGKVAWEKEAHRGKPFGGRHRKNTYASETPATDGQRVYVYFGNVGLYAYSMRGELLWEQHWEPRPIYMDFGTASSPVVHDGRVYIQSDSEGESFIVAVDAETGKELWKAAREKGGLMSNSGWSTPFVWENELRTEIVAIGKGLTISYDLEGNELWRLSGLSGQATPTPLAGAGMLFVGTGSQGESNRSLFAVRPGAAGDISLSKNEKSNDFVVWYHPRASAYIPSPLLYQGRLYVVRDNGILTVFDAKSGERLYRARVGGGGHTFASSPWVQGGKIFFLSEDGDTFVAEPGDAYKEVGKNSLEEMSLASPAVSGDSIYIRTKTKLYRISHQPTSSDGASR